MSLHSVIEANRAEVDETLILIRRAGLPFLSRLLLEAFVTEALNPVLAARYAKPRLQLGEASAMAADWSYIVESSESASFSCTVIELPNHQSSARERC